MAGEKQDGEPGAPAATEESGAGYGNNALTDDVALADEDEDHETMPDKAEG